MSTPRLLVSDLPPDRILLERELVDNEGVVLLGALAVQRYSGTRLTCVETESLYASLGFCVSRSQRLC